MAKALSRRSQVSYKAQTDYDTTITTISGFTVIESAIPNFSPATELFPVESIRSGHFRIAPVVGSTHGGTLTLSFPLTGYSSSVPAAATTPTADFLDICLKHILGSQTIQASTTTGVVSTWETGSPIEVANSPASSTYKAGAAIIGQVAGTTTGYEMQVLTAVTDGGAGSHTLDTLFPVAGSAPAGTGEIWGTVNNYLVSTGDAELAATDPVTIVIQGMNTATNVILGGCVAQSIKLPLSARANPIVEVTLICNDLREGVSGNAITATSYTKPRFKNPGAKNGGRLVIGTTSTDLQTLDLELSAQWSPVHSHNARTGVIGLVATDRMAKLTYSQLLTGATSNLSDLAHPAKLGAFFGSQPGQMMGVVMRSPVVTGLADFKDDNGIGSQTVTIEPGQYTGDTGSDATADSPFSVFRG